MDFKKHLEIAWNLTLRYITPLVFMTLVMFVVSFLTAGLLAPVTMAGYMHSILLMVRNEREPKIQDVFAHAPITRSTPTARMEAAIRSRALKPVNWWKCA